MSKTDWNLIWLAPVAALTQGTFAADYLTIPEAQKALFAEADRFEVKSVELTSAQMSRISSESGVRQRTNKPKIWVAYRGVQHLGFFLVDEVIGKHEYITYALATTAEGKVLGIEVVSYRETHGGQVRRPEWREKFKGKTLSDPFKLDVDVPNISGATLSCRNLLDGVKRLLILQKVIDHG